MNVRSIKDVFTPDFSWCCMFHPCMRASLDSLSIFLALIHIDCIQIAHVPASNCLHPHQSSSYLHAILSLALTGMHPPLTISLTLAPTFLQIFSFIGHIFHDIYFFCVIMLGWLQFIQTECCTLIHSKTQYIYTRKYYSNIPGCIQQILGDSTTRIHTILHVWDL